MTDSPPPADSVPNVDPVEIDRQQTHGDTVFPYVLLNQTKDCNLEQACWWVRDHRNDLLGLSTTHGVVLLRGFPLPTAEDFDAIVQSLSVPNFPYRKSLSNAVRVNRTERVFSANEAPADVQIFFHHEMAQTPIFPGRIFFYCEVASETGGATPICRSDVLYERLRVTCPTFLQACEDKGLCYTNVMPDSDDPNSGMGRSWQSTLEADSREAAEARLGELNYSWQWQDDGCLRVTTPPLPAVMEVSPGRKTFFNQLIAAFCGWKDTRNDPSQAIRHGDGSLLDANAVRQAIGLADELAFDVAWRPGDAALVDNTIAMHARRSFRGTRKVYASLADLRRQTFAIQERSS